MITKDTKIYIAGHSGMVGSAIWRELVGKGYTNLIGLGSKDLDLRSQEKTDNFFSTQKPSLVINAAAKVGGILANSTYPFQFLMDNMVIQNNLIQSSLKYDVPNFIFLGSSCIYPKFAPQPIKEEYLLTNSLEPTNEWYALAKITGVKSCEAIKKQYGLNYFSLMPTNLYGSFDNFDLNSSHVLPAMIRKFHEAKLKNEAVTLWGSGSPMREFLYVDDLADGVRFALENKMEESLYNIGTGQDISIKNLAHLIQKMVGHKGDIIWDETKPDGTPKKLLDVSKMGKLGWIAKTSLEEGIERTYSWFLENIDNYKQVKYS